MDWTHGYGDNMYALRMGPFYGDADHESDWAGIGGPYAGGPGTDWNPAFWQKYRELLAHAQQLGANVEVNVIDTWYCKHAQWGDQPMPWPDEDIQACGRRATPGQERYIRKVVSEAKDAPHVVWITDNEGGEIQGDTCDWFEWVRSVIRDEETRSGGAVRLVGTNNPRCAAGPFDYVATHARSPLTEPIAGKHTENNERNPDLGSPEAEHAAFCQARAAGLHWWYWRAEQSDSDMERTLQLNSQGCGEPVGCFPPVEDDPLWVVPPATGGGMSTEVRAAVDQAKANVGERCGTDHAGSLTTLDLVGADLRRQGFCAGRSADSVFVLDGGLWKELHLVTFASGCWSQDPAQVPKNTWTYSGAPPVGSCQQDVPTIDQITCKEHQSTNHIYDCTPKANGQPILPEGDPNRSACELKAMGGQWPVYSVSGGMLTVAPRENPMQFQLKGTGSGVVSCVVPVGTFCNLAVSQ